MCYNARVNADDLIKKLDLKPMLREGGFFRETYRGGETVSWNALPLRYKRDKSLATAIYYLLTPDTFSAMHRVASDEVFHFYAGDPVEMLQLHPDGSCSVVTIGNDIDAGHEPQVIVPRGVWQGCRLMAGGHFALMGTTVSPAFDPADYEHGARDALTAEYPECAQMIRELTND